MAPLTPHWVQPSHPEIQEVVINEAEFQSKSLSKVAVPPWGLYARLDFPPCTDAAEPTYATVQYGRDKHLNLNSDLLYINHSCEPSLIFDMGRLAVIAGPKGLQPGDELTFFYPSTEWDMAQPFDCLCGTETCRGGISGAGDMTAEQLSGLFLNKHIHELLEQKAANGNGPVASGNGASSAAAKDEDDSSALLVAENLADIARELREASDRAEKAAATACRALAALQVRQAGMLKAGKKTNGVSPAATFNAAAGSLRRGPTSRELSGEMGGDTSFST